MAKHKDAIDGDQSLAEIAAQIDGNRPEDQKPLTVREKRELARKARAFTARWQQANYENTMKALYDEVARLAGRMERWKTEELKLNQMRAFTEYKDAYIKDAPFDLVDEAIRLKAHIPRLRWRALNELEDKAMNAEIMDGDKEKADKIRAEADRIIREKMPAAAFRIYEIWCIVGKVIHSDADKRMVLKLSDYEEYDFEYKEEDL